MRGDFGRCFPHAREALGLLPSPAFRFQRQLAAEEKQAAESLLGSAYAFRCLEYLRALHLVPGLPPRLRAARLCASSLAASSLEQRRLPPPEAQATIKCASPFLGSAAPLPPFGRLRASRRQLRTQRAALSRCFPLAHEALGLLPSQAFRIQTKLAAEEKQAASTSAPASRARRRCSRVPTCRRRSRSACCAPSRATCT